MRISSLAVTVLITGCVHYPMPTLIEDECAEKGMEYGSYDTCVTKWTAECTKEASSENSCRRVLESKGQMILIAMECQKPAYLATFNNNPALCDYANRHPSEYMCAMQIGNQNTKDYYACVEHYEAEAWRKKQEQQIAELKARQDAADQQALLQSLNSLGNTLDNINQQNQIRTLQNTQNQQRQQNNQQQGSSH